MSNVTEINVPFTVLPEDPIREIIFSGHYSVEKRQEMATQVFADRDVQGVSDQDWWNFHTYLLFLMDRIADTGNAPAAATNEYKGLRNAAQRVVEMSDDLLDIPSMSLSDNMLSEISKASEGPIVLAPVTHPSMRVLLDASVEIEAAANKIEQQAVDTFFTRIFPTLPFVAGYSMPPVSHAGARSTGFADEDVATLGSFFSSVLVTGLEMFRSEKSHSYPADVESVDAWHAELGRMIDPLRQLLAEGWTAENSAGAEIAVANLVRRFATLWD